MQPNENQEESYSPAGDRRSNRYQSAELTCWVLERLQPKENEPKYINVYSVLILRQNSLEPDEGGFEYTNPARVPESLPATSHRLVCFTAKMPLSDVDELLCFDEEAGTFVIPVVNHQHGAPTPIRCRGEWHRPRLVPRDALPYKDLLPWLPSVSFVAEREPNTQELEVEVKSKGVAFLRQELKSRLGIDLRKRPDLLGGFLVVWPEYRVLFRGVTFGDLRTVGTSIYATGVPTSSFRIVARGTHAGELVDVRIVESPKPHERFKLDSEHDGGELYLLDEYGDVVGADFLGGSVRGLEMSVGSQPASWSTQPASVVQPMDSDGLLIGPPSR
ncbi:MAG: hypothetical protein ABIP48_09135 [Planctomycetota bacterium]